MGIRLSFADRFLKHLFRRTKIFHRHHIKSFPAIPRNHLENGIELGLRQLFGGFDPIGSFTGIGGNFEHKNEE